jgi:hypothetical protein
MAAIRKLMQRFVAGMTTDVGIDYHWAMFAVVSNARFRFVKDVFRCQVAISGTFIRLDELCLVLV